jgi:thiol-disulfide isomerase/thioredoxin
LNPAPAIESGSGPNVVVGTAIGQQAPEITLTDTDGEYFSLSSYRGSVVVIDFMATWCGPCVTELDHLKELEQIYGIESVRIVSIDVDDRETREQLRAFKNEHGCDWRFVPYGGEAGGQYGASSIPTMYIIDQKGIVRFKSMGVTPTSTLEAEIDKLV